MEFLIGFMTASWEIEPQVEVMNELNIVES